MHSCTSKADRTTSPSRGRARRRYTVTMVTLLTLALIGMLPGGQAQARAFQQAGTSRIQHSLKYPPVATTSAPIIQATQGTQQSFPATADAEVRSGAPAQNFGIQSALGVGYSRAPEEPREIQRSLLNFNISTFLPPGTIVHQAQLQLYLGGYCEYSLPGVLPPALIRTYRVDADWSEMDITWNNQPNIAEEYGNNAIVPVEGWYNFDLTGLAQQWVSGAAREYGVMLQGPETSANPCAYRDFYSKGGGGFDQAPKLVVDYTLPAPALALDQSNITITQPCGVVAPPSEPQALTIASNSDDLADWSINVSGDSSWLQLSRTSGQVSRLFPTEIAVSAGSVADCPTARSAQLQVSAPALGTPRSVTIQLVQTKQRANYLPLLQSAGSPPVPSTPAPRRIAILVGIADYEYLTPQPTYTDVRPGIFAFDLLAPLSDVFAMLKALTLHGDFARIHPLAEKQATADRTRYAIMEYGDDHPCRGAGSTAAEIAASCPIKLTPQPVDLLLYFSTHGGHSSDLAPQDEADGKDEFLGVYDTNSTQQGLVNAIMDDDLKTWIAGLNIAHLAIIFDACNSGGMEIAAPNRAVLAASLEDENSLESGSTEHGVFTYYMLQAMHNPACDTNHDGWLSIKEIYDCARGPVNSFSSQGQHLQLDMTSDFNLVRMQ